MIETIIKKDDLKAYHSINQVIKDKSKLSLSEKKHLNKLEEIVFTKICELGIPKETKDDILDDLCKLLNKMEQIYEKGGYYER